MKCPSARAKRCMRSKSKTVTPRGGNHLEEKGGGSIRKGRGLPTKPAGWTSRKVVVSKRQIEWTPWEEGTGGTGGGEKINKPKRPELTTTGRG